MGDYISFYCDFYGCERKCIFYYYGNDSAMKKLTIILEIYSKQQQLQLVIEDTRYISAS